MFETMPSLMLGVSDGVDSGGRASQAAGTFESVVLDFSCSSLPETSPESTGGEVKDKGGFLKS